MFCNTEVTFRKDELTEKKTDFLNKWIHLKVYFVLFVFKNSRKTRASATASLLIGALANICPYSLPVCICLLVDVCHN